MECRRLQPSAAGDRLWNANMTKFEKSEIYDEVIDDFGNFAGNVAREAYGQSYNHYSSESAEELAERLRSFAADLHELAGNLDEINCIASF